MNGYTVVPLAMLVLAIIASFFTPPDRLGIVPTFVFLGVVSAVLYYLAIYGLLSLSSLRPFAKALWAIGVPVAVALILLPFSVRDSRTGLGFMSMDVPAVYLLTLPAQLVVTPGFKFAKNAEEDRLARITPDPNEGDLLELDATGLYEARIHDVALQPDGAVLLLLDLQGGGKSARRLARFLPDGRIDSGFAFHLRGVSHDLKHLEVGPSGEILLHGDALLDPIHGELDTRALLLSADGSLLKTVEVVATSERKSVRFDPTGSLWALSVADVDSGGEPVWLEEVIPLQADTPPQRRNLRPAIKSVGPLKVDDFFFLPDGGVGLVGETLGERGAPVLVRISSGGRAVATPHPLSPDDFRGLLEGERVLLGDRYIYDFRADVVGVDGASIAIPSPEVKERINGHATSGAGSSIVVAGWPPIGNPAGSPRSFRLVKVDLTGAIDPGFSVRRE